MSTAMSFREALEERLRNEHPSNWGDRRETAAFMAGAKAALALRADKIQAGLDKFRSEPIPEGCISLGPLFNVGTVMQAEAEIKTLRSLLRELEEK